MGLLEIIAAGISIITSLSNYFQMRQAQNAHSANPQLAASIRTVNNRLRAVEKAISKPSSQRNNEVCLRAYNKLIKALKENKHYSAELKFKRTNYGTWKLVKRKKTILRDPKGEYGKFQL